MGIPQKRKEKLFLLSKMSFNDFAKVTILLCLIRFPFMKQAISASEQALCQLTVCFEFQRRSDRRKGHKSYALEMVLRSKVRR